MPVCSYLIYPEAGSAAVLKQRLGALPTCTVYPAENHDLVILLTDTATPEAEQELQEQLKSMKEIQCMALTFAHSEEDPS